MAETKSMRVVPSGKIYRQMFEAQVQLNRSLTKIPRETTSLKTSKAGTSIPIVRLSKGEVEHGLLGDRQRTWAEGFPNDPYVENPVVYKQYAEFVGSQMQEPESSVEGREVRGLPDVIAPIKEGSNIIERIAESRRKRHEATVEEMHQELSVINSELEPTIAETCETLMRKLEEDDRDIASTLARFEKDEDLLSYTLEGLYDLWEEVQGHSEVRQSWIQDLDSWLKKTEDDRMEMIKRVFMDYAKALEKIAHVLLPDLQRFMDKESQLINQTVLSNRRAYGDLFVRLMSSDIEREKAQHIHWKRRVDDWKMLKTELAIDRYKTFMNDEKVVSPPGAEKVLQYMVKEQEVLNEKRLELVNQLRELKPPSSTKSAVYHWNKGVQDISQEIDTTSQLHLSSLHKEYETVCQTCLDEIDAIETQLVDTGVCSASRAKTVVEQFMLPLVGDRQRIYEQNLETMEKALEEHNKTTLEQLKSLFKFAQGAAHVWDVHEIGLARQERALQENLEQCRQQHDNQNQDKEAHLDIIMDRMRQDATEKNLKDSLTKALEMLEKIRHAYEIFHRDQTNIVKQYPDMVKGELKNFDIALCQLFMVDRNNPLDPKPNDEESENVEEEQQDTEGEGGNSSAKGRKGKTVKFKSPKTSTASKTPKSSTRAKSESPKDKMKGSKTTGVKAGNGKVNKEKKHGKTTPDKDRSSSGSSRNKATPTGFENRKISNESDNERKEASNGSDQSCRKVGSVSPTNSVSKFKDVSDGLDNSGRKVGSVSPANSVPLSRESTDVSLGLAESDREKSSAGSFMSSKDVGDYTRATEVEENGLDAGNSETEQEQFAIKATESTNEQHKESLSDGESIPLVVINGDETDETITSKRSRNYTNGDILDDCSRVEEESSDIEEQELANIREDASRESSMISGGNLASKEVIDFAGVFEDDLEQYIFDDTNPAGDLDSNISEGSADSKKKKKTPRIPFKKDTSKDLPSPVNEVLSTNKGTIFYVVTVAGEYGIPSESESLDQDKSPGMAAFMTEVSGTSSREDGIPDYLREIDVPESLLIEIKKTIRMNFLNHLEEWTEQAAERASSVVVAKCEELNSELDLRLHLHKPRSRRAEYDVHNVRAAELVMHSERVTRHCKGIQQALTEVRNRFTNMTNEHNNLAAKFRQEIESLEVVFINATKASRLYGLKNQLNVELDKFMSIIRASLRQFRQHLDETLQMLRESNARFIKSFKVFSDGGNFCPEEIDEYRKRLDKMATNIDKSEGLIMSDLEDMESKRLEQATKVAMEFEDRFKSHMFDLIFMEKIARWLTNTQVKIKAEVAKSNTQAQKLSQHLLDIDRRVDACERPNLDKEQITPEELNDSLKGVFEAFQTRSEFLNCLKDLYLRPPSGGLMLHGLPGMHGAPAVGARVGFVQDMGPTPISKAGKQPTEDPSVGVIKTIMKSNKSRLRFGMDADLDGEYAQTGERDKIKSALSTNTSSDRGKANQSRTGPSPGVISTNEGTVRKAQSAASSYRSVDFHISKGKEKVKETKDPVIDVTVDEDDDGASTSSATKTDSWSRRSSKPAKFEKKAVIFGDGMEEDENNTQHFLGIIRRTLKEALDGLLAAAELYYRQKGARTVTRPQALQETFDQCYDVLVQKLQSYYQQSYEYHNQCLQETKVFSVKQFGSKIRPHMLWGLILDSNCLHISSIGGYIRLLAFKEIQKPFKEFRAQLTQLEKCIAHVPPLVMSELLKDQLRQTETARSSFESQFTSTFAALNKRQREHEQLLRPTLGHPHQKNKLEALCKQETDRHNEYIAAVEQHTKALQDSAVANAKSFVESMARLSENQLLQFDNMLVVDDVNKGRVEPTKYPTTELIRRKNAGEPLEDDEDKHALPRGKSNWQGIPCNQMVIGDAPTKVQKTASINTAKTTLGHSAVVKARDQCYQDYKVQFEKALQQIEEEKQKLMVAEQRWMESWNTSVEKVKQLY